MIRCIAFDLDDLLIPTAPVFAAMWREHGVTATRFRKFLRGAYRATLCGEADLLDVLPAALDALGFAGSAEDFAAAWMDACPDCDPEIVAVVRELRARGVACCAVSNQDAVRARCLDAMAPLPELFDQRFYSCRIGAAKPSRACFEAIAAALDLPPETILLVDDRRDNVLAARAVGWQSEHCTDAASLRAALHAHLPETIGSRLPAGGGPGP